jgi:Spy/CpxP family protein refolding chaperone
MNKPWKLIVLLVGIFLAGAGSGTLVTMRMLRRPPPGNRPPPSAELWATQHLKRVREDLDLQPAQLEQIKPIVERRMIEIFNLRGRFLENNHAMREVMEREVAEFLTPEQRAKYDQMNREYHERARRMERGERPPPDHADRPPGK